MLINWFTVGAQTLNFLILVWLMKRFLYKPIRKAIDEREARISRELANADTRKTDAEKEGAEFKRKNDEFDAHRAALLKKAINEVQAERVRLLEDARSDAAALHSKREEALRNEEHGLAEVIRTRTQREVFAIARRVLTDLASASLEERMVDTFIRRLRELGGDTKSELAKALATSVAPTVVRSAFDLIPEQWENIHNALNQTFSADIPLAFETAPELISGIELAANGQKVAWNILDYLASMEKGVDEILKERNQSKDTPTPISKEPQGAAGSQPQGEAWS